MVASRRSGASLSTKPLDVLIANSHHLNKSPMQKPVGYCRHNTKSVSRHILFSLLLQVSLFLLPSLRGALLVVGILLMIDVVILGFMAIWGLPLNLLTMVNLTISIGRQRCAVRVRAHTFSNSVCLKERLCLMRVPCRIFRRLRNSYNSRLLPLHGPEKGPPRL